MRPLKFSDLRNVQLLCAHLQTTPRALQSFIREPEQYYNALELPRGRGRRPRRVFEITAPLRRLHRVLAFALIPHVRGLPAYVQGFRKGRGIRSNAKRHVNAQLVVTADIRGFFDNITVDRVVAMFRRLGAPFQAAVLLGRVATYKGTLPQGGRASPAISNLVVRDLDRALLSLAGKSRYSRYADDLAFSGDGGDCPTEAELRDVLATHGFELRPKSYKRQLRKSGQIVTGLSVVNDKPTLTRRKRREIERALYFGALYGLTSHTAHIAPHRPTDPQRDFARLEGHINAAGAVDKRLRQRWRKLLEKVVL
jgi:hypothetical protein